MSLRINRITEPEYQWFAEIYKYSEYESILGDYIIYLIPLNIKSPEDIPKCPCCGDYCDIRSERVIEMNEMYNSNKKDRKKIVFKKTCKNEDCIDKLHIRNEYDEFDFPIYVGIATNSW